MANEPDEQATEPMSAEQQLAALETEARLARQQRSQRLLAALDAGDVVFFKTGSASTFFDLGSAVGFGDFTVLAAFAQGLPYVLAPGGNVWAPGPAHFKPWHHVGICTGRDGGVAEVVQFVQAASERADGEPAAPEITLTAGPLAIPAGQDVDVLRGPETYDTAVAVAAATDQVAQGTTYATSGLLAFALATAARMLTGAPRTLELQRAYGAHVRARGLGTPSAPVESCATAAAKAVEAGLHQQDRLALTEPPEPERAEAAKLFAYADTPHSKVMRLLLGRIERAGTRRAVGRIGAIRVGDLRARVPQLCGAIADLDDDDTITGPDLLAASEVRTTDQIRDALGAAAALPPDVVVFSPGPDVSTPRYLEHLELAIEMTLNGDGGPHPSLEEQGAADLAIDGHPSADHLVVSPAMLWDALVAAGFREPV